MKIQQEIVYIIYAHNDWICRKIEYSELQKFDEKFYTLYMYEMFGFAEKLNIQNCENSTGNCLHYKYGSSGFVEKLIIQNCENSTGN